jgi:hypothetical protein
MPLKLVAGITIREGIDLWKTRQKTAEALQSEAEIRETLISEAILRFQVCQERNMEVRIIKREGTWRGVTTKVGIDFLERVCL